MKKQLVLCAGILSGTILSTSTSRASVVYNYVTDQPAYTVAPGGIVTAYVYLREALTNGSTSIITQENGLAGAGFSATRSGSAPSSPTLLSSIAGSIRSNGENFLGGFFEESTGKESTSHRRGTEILNSTSQGPVPNAYDPADGQTDLIELGSFTLTGGDSTGTTSFILANYGYPAITLQEGGSIFTATFGSGTPENPGLDYSSTTPDFTGTTNSFETFTVTVTPEPSFVSLLGVGAFGLLARRKTFRPGCNADVRGAVSVNQ